jgi:hypothetical protein
MCFEIGRIDATYRLNGSARKLVRGTSAALTHGTCDEVRAAFTEAVSLEMRGTEISEVSGALLKQLEAVSRVDAVAPVTGESTR